MIAKEMNNDSNHDDLRECLQITPDGRSTFYLKDGRNLPLENLKIGKIIPKNFNIPLYPGDLDDKNADWVIDSTISIDKLYPSQFYFFIFADPMLKANYIPQFNNSNLKKTIDNILNQLKRFSDYIEDKYKKTLKILVIGTGELTNFTGYVDLIDLLEKFPNYSFMSFDGYTGVYFNKIIKDRLLKRNDNPILKIGERTIKKRSDFSREEQSALKILESIDEIERLEVIADLETENGPFNSIFKSYAPDILCKAKRGKHFTSSSGIARRIYKIHGYEDKTGFRTINRWNRDFPLTNITDVFNSTLSNLNDGPVALAIIEGASYSNISGCSEHLNTTWGNLPYGADHNFIQAVTTGNSAFKSSIPYGISPQVTKTNDYPYGWGIPPLQNTLGSDHFKFYHNIKSLSAGSRSMFLHMFSGSDICIEPWVRNRIENGVLIVTNKDQIIRKKNR